MSWRVLLVEDDDDIRETLASMLAARGLNVVSARNGRDALERVHADGNRPSLVILDLMMPVMDGETFLREQSADPLLAHVPVIVLTAQLQHPDPLPPTVRGVLIKPFDLPTLLAAVEQVWNERRTPAAPMIANGTGGLPTEIPQEEPGLGDLSPPPEPAASTRPGSEPTEP